MNNKTKSTASAVAGVAVVAAVAAGAIAMTNKNTRDKVVKKVNEGYKKIKGSVEKKQRERQAEKVLDNVKKKAKIKKTN
jgi:hypothetical protein